ncbi:MAG: SDR family oxidoreductase [Polyangiaceae bacterium]
MRFQGKSAIVTGASRGLGAALAQGLAREGARVVLVARDEAPLSAVVEAIRDAGGEAHALSADLGEKQDIHRISGAAAALVGPIDIVVHNASTLGKTPLRSLLDTECEDFERVLAVNLLGPFRLSRALAGSMLLRGGGTLLHVSSDAAQNAYADWGAYSVSKAALDHLSRLWAEELRPFGVRALSVDPGEMDTQMHRAALPDADPKTLARPETVAERILQVLADPELPSGSRVEAANYGGES